MSNIKLKKSNFIHIPKCAGTFAQAILYKLDLVSGACYRPSNGHLFLNQMPDKDTKFNFCFVRHPYTWWPSFWNWSKRDRFSEMEKECPNFDTWIQEYGPFWMGHYSKLVQRYIGEDPIFNTTGAKMHFIGKTENLFQDLKTALALSEEKFSEELFDKIEKEYMSDFDILPSLNKGKYNKNISDVSKELIYKTEKYVFDKFNYSK